MAWARIDDGFYDHPKVVRLAARCPAAGFLHVCAIAYCSKHLTNGLIDKEMVARFTPVQRDRDEQVNALLETGLWFQDDETGPDRYGIHHFLDYQPKKEDVIERRRKDRQRKAEQS
jgi:hypothetical protein